MVVELCPDGKGGATVVWQWSLWDHLIQDYDEKVANYGDVAQHPELYDINYCPPGGKAASRNQERLSTAPRNAQACSGLTTFQGADGKTGEKDWIHCNAVGYCAQKNLIVLSFNVPSEVVVIERGSSTAESSSHQGGAYGRGGDILCRWGNPQSHRQGTRMEQSLFVQHCSHFVAAGYPGAGNVLLFNNGRAPDRHWSSVDEFMLPDIPASSANNSTDDKAVSIEEPRLVWQFGPQTGDSIVSTAPTPVAANV